MAVVAKSEYIQGALGCQKHLQAYLLDLLVYLDNDKQLGVNHDYQE